MPAACDGVLLPTIVHTPILLPITIRSPKVLIRADVIIAHKTKATYVTTGPAVTSTSTSVTANVYTSVTKDTICLQ